MAKISPTQNTLKHMRSLGYLCQVVEVWNTHARRRIDLFGIIDVLCVGSGEVVGVQATSYANISSRVKKITDSEVLPTLRDADIKILVHGWRKVKNKWTLKQVDLS